MRTGKDVSTTDELAAGGGEGAPVAPLLLIDGHSLAYRAFYALPDTIATDEGGYASFQVKPQTNTAYKIVYSGYATPGYRPGSSRRSIGCSTTWTASCRELVVRHGYSGAPSGRFSLRCHSRRQVRGIAPPAPTPPGCR